jgi:hypothetical protein
VTTTETQPYIRCSTAPLDAYMCAGARMSTHERRKHR